MKSIHFPECYADIQYQINLNKAKQTDTQAQPPTATSLRQAYVNHLIHSRNHIKHTKSITPTHYDLIDYSSKIRCKSSEPLAYKGLRIPLVVVGGAKSLNSIIAGLKNVTGKHFENKKSHVEVKQVTLHKKSSTLIQEELFSFKNKFKKIYNSSKTAILPFLKSKTSKNRSPMQSIPPSPPRCHTAVSRKRTPILHVEFSEYKRKLCKETTVHQYVNSKADTITNQYPDQICTSKTLSKIPQSNISPYYVSSFPQPKRLNNSSRTQKGSRNYLSKEKLREMIRSCAHWESRKQMVANIYLQKAV